MSSPLPPQSSSTLTNIAQAFLGKHLDDPDRDYMVRQHVISKSANTLDEFAIVCWDTSNVLAKSEQECVAGLLEREASVPKDTIGIRKNVGEFVQHV
ncbi:hypothetical protein E4U22_008029, partial [Claviceps purpurea]